MGPELTGDSGIVEFVKVSERNNKPCLCKFRKLSYYFTVYNYLCITVTYSGTFSSTESARGKCLV